MVFVPTHQDPAEPHEAAATPRRPDHLTVPNPEEQPRKLAWRAVVHASDKESIRTSWHLTMCSAPQDPQAHCRLGQELMATQQDPDGHCLVDGRCGRGDHASSAPTDAC